MAVRAANAEPRLVTRGRRSPERGRVVARARYLDGFRQEGTTDAFWAFLQEGILKTAKKFFLKEPKGSFDELHEGEVATPAIATN